MIASDFSAVELKQCLVHFVPPADSEKACVFSHSNVSLSPEQSDLLLQYFLSPIKTEEFFHFHHDDGLTAHTLHSLIRDIFNEPSRLLGHSRVIAEQLHQHSTHPNIKEGYFTMAYFSDLVLVDEVFDAVGIFKSESIAPFLKLNSDAKGVHLAIDEGFSLDSLDKACLIFNTEEEDGYRTLLVDKARKSDEARFWKEDFLGLEALADGYHQTRQFMTVAKDFITKQLGEEQDITKAETIALLNRSVEYFQKNARCEPKEFAKAVFRDEERESSFNEFSTNKALERGQNAPESFDISAPAVKKQQRIFKSVLKLDKNFHIYIHGNQEMIEKGVERDGRKFYKIYYKDES